MKINTEIENLIPHRKPILCVDEVISVDGLVAKTFYKIEENGLFVTDGTFSELGLIENAAQSSFVFLKFFFENSKEDLGGEGEDSVGFISQISELSIHSLPAIGEKLITTTHTELVFDAENLKICNVEAKTFVAEKLVFEAEMKLILQTHTP